MAIQPGHHIAPAFSCERARRWVSRLSGRSRVAVLTSSVPTAWMALDVGPSQVVQVVEVGDWGLVAEGAVWAAMVVGPEPAVKGGGAFSAGAVDRAVGPAAEHGADEALGFAVGARPVGLGAQV